MQLTQTIFHESVTLVKGRLHGTPQDQSQFTASIYTLPADITARLTYKLGIPRVGVTRQLSRAERTLWARAGIDQ